MLARMVARRARHALINSTVQRMGEEIVAEEQFVPLERWRWTTVEV